MCVCVCVRACVLYVYLFQVYGPLTVDITPPSVNGEVAVSIVKHGDTEYVLGKWPSHLFVEENTNNVISNYVASIG